MTGEPAEKNPPQWAVWVARAISIVIVVPLTLVWEWFKAVGRLLVVRPVAAIARFLRRWLFAPTGKALLALGRLLVRFLLRPFWDLLVWISQHVLRPAGRGLRAVLVPIGRFLRAVLLIPLAWCLMTLVVAPLRWLWQAVLAPVGRWVGKALSALARLFGAALEWAYLRVAQPLWRFLATIARYVYRVVLTPIGRAIAAPARWVRDYVIAPTRLAVRRLRLQIGRAFGRG
ncbi:hypothetical protein [Allokutzneria albata]|uniref:Uncharacterized protein n=1 Tax=Allokutzneria albata TaxID=211114 RepID=A0A1G9U534_ALLAB|nr:hypothetical protein [Allokutzneria albata]SDM55100.1 hypothetical protein SAMN04489726_2192 [Allokutzneria albata]